MSTLGGARFFLQLCPGQSHLPSHIVFSGVGFGSVGGVGLFSVFAFGALSWVGEGHREVVERVLVLGSRTCITSEHLPERAPSVERRGSGEQIALPRFSPVLGLLGDGVWEGFCSGVWQVSACSTFQGRLVCCAWVVASVARMAQFSLSSCWEVRVE